jgi:hypothetical protein
MRRRTLSRAVLTAGAFSIAMAAPAAAQTDVTKKRLQVRAGQSAVAVGTAPGPVASLQIRRRGAWRSIDRDRTTATGRFVLRARFRRTLTAPARVASGGETRPLGRLNVYRFANASWYGPGLYGNKLGCGGRLVPGRGGVAHKTVPSRPHRPRARDRPRALRGRPRVRPDRGHRPQAAVPRPRGDFDD